MTVYIRWEKIRRVSWVFTVSKCFSRAPSLPFLIFLLVLCPLFTKLERSFFFVPSGVASQWPSTTHDGIVPASSPLVSQHEVIAYSRRRSNQLVLYSVRVELYRKIFWSKTSLHGKTFHAYVPNRGRTRRDKLGTARSLSHSLALPLQVLIFQRVTHDSLQWWYDEQVGPVHTNGYVRKKRVTAQCNCRPVDEASNHGRQRMWQCRKQAATWVGSYITCRRCTDRNLWKAEQNRQ